jgi:hypothetical protein
LESPPSATVRASSLTSLSDVALLTTMRIAGSRLIRERC